MVIEINGFPHIVRYIESRSPSARGSATIYRVRYTNLQTRQKLEENYKGDRFLTESDCVRMNLQFTYIDGDNYIFMNMDDFNQYSIAATELEDQSCYLHEGLDGITALIIDDQLRAIELPNSVELTITDTTPGIKGATATGRTKPARLVTGLEVQVPEYLENGDTIKINTVTGKYISKA
jgi:elongation factor P